MRQTTFRRPHNSRSHTSGGNGTEGAGVADAARFLVEPDLPGVEAFRLALEDDEASGLGFLAAGVNTNTPDGGRAVGGTAGDDAGTAELLLDAGTLELISPSVDALAVDDTEGKSMESAALRFRGEVGLDASCESIRVTPLSAAAVAIQRQCCRYDYVIAVTVVRKPAAPELCLTQIEQSFTRVDAFWRHSKE